MKTLAIRLDEDQHAQLSMIAQLENLTMIDAIRQAISDWVGARRDKPELKERAAALLSEIEQQAATRRGALAALLGDASSADVGPSMELDGDSRPTTAGPTGGRNRPRGGKEITD